MTPPWPWDSGAEWPGAILIRVELLGIFEDGTQRDFLVTLVESVAPRHGYEAVVEARLTRGCRPDNLREHLALASR